MDAPASTARLLQRARDGDRAAYDRLFALAADRLLLYVRLRLGKGLRDRLESMDVVQEAYLEAWKDLATFEPRDDGAFARWLCRVAENRLRGLADHHGAQKRQARDVEDVRRTLPGPATSAARRETRVRVEAALDRLEPDEREVLLLRHFQGLTIDEAAVVLGRSATAVRRLLGRAARRLGEELAGA